MKIILRNPCKKCLVKACCTMDCEKKIYYDSNGIILLCSLFMFVYRDIIYPFYFVLYKLGLIKKETWLKKKLL
jgi:hypothetical protein